MLPDAGMLVFVLVFVGVLVGVLVAVFVISLHGRSSVFLIVGKRPARSFRPCRTKRATDAAASSGLAAIRMCAAVVRTK
jgi:hypothetical protein